MSWQTKSLNEISTNFDSKRVPITKGNREPGEIPYYGASGIVDYVKDYIFDGDYLLVSEDGANLLDRNYPIAFTANGKFWVNNHAHILKFNEKITHDFAEYFLNSISLVPFVSGMAQPKLDQAMLNKIQIPFPPLQIQEKIVAKLDTIFAEIDKATAAAEANAKNAEALFQSYLTQIFEHEKDEWRQTNLKDIAEYFNGLTYSPKNVSDEGVVVLRSSNVQDDKILLNDIVRVNSSIKEKLYVKLGDILMCSRNGSQRLVGKTATIENLDEKMTFGTFMMIVRSESNFFIEWFFKSDLFKRQIASGENTMINQITRYMLDEIVIPMPDLATQKSISKNISNLYNTSQILKLSYTRKVEELKLYKKSILTQAFNGELIKE